MITLIFLSIVIVITAQDLKATEPSMFNYGQIPFGKSIDEVLKKVEGAEVTSGDSDNVSIEAVGDYEGLLEYFEGGIYTYFGIGSYLNSDLTKKYVVTYEGWSNIKEIDLYFSKEFEANDSYTLFLVRKEYNPIEGSYKNVFNGMKDSITKIIGVKPIISKVKYEDLMLKSSYSYLDALIGIWKTKDTKIFLLVHSGLFSLAESEILYVDNRLWKGISELVKIRSYIRRKNKKKKGKEY